jgi:arylsulfatase
VDLIPTLLELAGGDPSQLARAYPALPGVSVARAVADARHRGERDARGILFSFGGAHTYDPAYAEALARQHVDPDRLLPVRALLAGLPPWPRRDQPTLARGIHTGTHKFARYFKPAEHHRPVSWETLIQHNTLELVDVRRDPREQDNLAHAPEWNRALVTELNERLDRLIAREVGSDLGDELPGPAFLKRL